MRRTFIRLAVAAVFAVAFNAILRTVVRHVAHVPNAFDPFTWPPIIVATLAGVAAGALVYAALNVFLRERTDRVFTWVGYVVLVVSLVTPITLLGGNPPQYPGTTLLTVAALELMHVSTGIATIVALTTGPR